MNRKFSIIGLIGVLLCLLFTGISSAGDRPAPALKANCLTVYCQQPEVLFAFDDLRVVLVRLRVADSQGELLYDSGETAAGVAGWDFRLSAADDAAGYDFQGWDGEGNLLHWCRGEIRPADDGDSPLVVTAYDVAGNYTIGGSLGVGTTAPERSIHLKGNNALFRMDRSQDTAAFMLVRTDSGGTPLKTFVAGVNSDNAGQGQFVINDLGAAVTGGGTRRMTIGNTGDVIFTGNVQAAGFTTTGGGTAGGLAAVAHDTTLDGKGTTVSPLGIAGNAITTEKLADNSVGPAKIKSPGVATANIYDNAITIAKLNVSGTVARGMTLGTDGTGLVWQDASGSSLTLPYSDSGSTASGADLFRLENTGSGRGIHVISSTDTALWAVSFSGRGIDGRSTSGSGIYGESSSGAGVSGTSSTYCGVAGSSTSSDGVNGSTEAAGKSGVWGHSTAGIGVTGSSSSGTGVSGTSSTSCGVKGSSTSDDGIAGVTEATGKSGVWGHSTKGIGVTGSSSGDAGVHGWSSSTDSNVPGVWARNTGAGPAIYAEAGSGKMAAVMKGNVRLLNYSSGATVMELGEGLDYAEGFDLAGETAIPPGSVLVIDPAEPGKLTLSVKAYDRRVAGIAAGAGGLGSGVRLGAGTFDIDVALAGRVYCNVDASEGAIEPGDLLTTSAIPGCAMKAGDQARAQGAILGKAMQPLAKGKRGQILVLVTLQ